MEQYYHKVSVATFSNVLSCTSTVAIKRVVYTDQLIKVNHSNITVSSMLFYSSHFSANPVLTLKSNKKFITNYLLTYSRKDYVITILSNLLEPASVDMRAKIYGC